MLCPVCNANDVHHFRCVSSYNYYECNDCGSLFLEPTVLDEIDTGRSLVNYTDDYWHSELVASRDRSFGPSLARVAETFLYARRPISNFLDVGAGGGFLLDSLKIYLPNSTTRFYGIEKFPPKFKSDNPNLIIGEISDLDFHFDAGVCIEVIEHLTPRMLQSMLRDLSMVSTENAIYIFNSGQPDFVKFEDGNYLDPTARGHLVSYSIKGVEALANALDFRVHKLPGKTWAFAMEKTSAKTSEIITDRIWSSVESNRSVLNDPKMGSVMYLLGIESARAYK